MTHNRNITTTVGQQMYVLYLTCNFLDAYSVTKTSLVVIFTWGERGLEKSLIQFWIFLKDHTGSNRKWIMDYGYRIIENGLRILEYLIIDN